MSRPKIAVGLLAAIIVAVGVFLYTDHPKTRALRVTRLLEFADTVEIYRLQGQRGQMEDELFPIKPYGVEANSFGVIKLDSKATERFRQIWSDLPIDDKRGALCHEPVYGVRFYTADRLSFETSICWVCENFYVDSVVFGSRWIGFRSESPEARILLEFCDEILPYDRNFKIWVDREAKEYLESLRGR